MGKGRVTVIYIAEAKGMPTQKELSPFSMFTT